MAYKSLRERRHESYEKEKWEDAHDMPTVRRHRNELFALSIVILLSTMLFITPMGIAFIIGGLFIGPGIYRRYK